MPDVVTIYLFGSEALSQTHAASDVDIAILAPHRLVPLARWDLQEQLARVLRRSVDLVDLCAASTVMKAQVLAHDVILYDGNPTLRATFEAEALASYARLNEERRGILDDILERGRVYG